MYSNFEEVVRDNSVVKPVLQCHKSSFSNIIGYALSPLLFKVNKPQYDI